MRIALITPGFSINKDDWALPSIQSFASAIAQSHEVHVFSLRYPRGGLYEDMGISHHAIGGGAVRRARSFRIWWDAYQTIKKQHRKTPFDILHACWADESGLVGAIAAKRLDLPLLVNIGGGELVFLKEIGYGTQGSLLRRWIVRIVFKQADLVSVGSKYTRQLVRQFGVPAKRMIDLPYGVDISHFRPDWNADTRNPTIIQAASLTQVKNQGKLLEVFRIALERMAGLELIVAGSGPLEDQLKLLAANLGIGDHVQWLGPIPYPEMPAVYRSADLYLQSSLHESQGMSVLESMASGLPSIGTPVGILPEVSCKPASNDSHELAKQVVDIFGDQQQQAHLQRLARKTVEGNFDMDTCIARYRHAYQSLSRM